MNHHRFNRDVRAWPMLALLPVVVLVATGCVLWFMREVKTTKSVTALPGAPEGQYVVMQFDTSFTSKKSAIETVTFKLKKDGKWKDTGYFIK